MGKAVCFYLMQNSKQGEVFLPNFNESLDSVEIRKPISDPYWNSKWNICNYFDEIFFYESKDISVYVIEFQHIVRALHKFYTIDIKEIDQNKIYTEEIFDKLFLWIESEIRCFASLVDLFFPDDKKLIYMKIED